MRRSGISSRVHATKVAATKVAATNLPFSPRHSQSRVDTLSVTSRLPLLINRRSSNEHIRSKNHASMIFALGYVHG